VIRRAIELFEEMGLKPTIYRMAVSAITRKLMRKQGYFGASPNKQYEFDHQYDLAMFLDKKFIERKLDVMKNAFEQYRDWAHKHAGPAVVEMFGEEPFSPMQKEMMLPCR
jgi:hypothetical protein